MGLFCKNVKAGPETEEDMTVRVLKWCRKDTVKQAVLILLMLVTIMLGKSGWEEDDAGRHSYMIENGGYSASE